MSAAGFYVDRRPLVEQPLAPGRVEGRDHAASIPGQVVEVAQRDLDADDGVGCLVGQAQSAGDRPGATGDDDRQRDLAVGDLGYLVIGDDQ